MLDVMDLYKVFAVIDILLVIRRIVLIKRNPPGAIYYQTYLFAICAVLAFLCTLTLMLVTEFSNPPMPPLLELPIEQLCMWLIFLLIDFCITFALFIFSGKYATYRIVYYPKKKKKPVTVNVEDSYIIRHKLFRNQIIQVRDVIPKQSFYYRINGKSSKLFPNAQLLGSEEYMTIMLKGEKMVKLQNNMLFLSASSIRTLSELYDLSKALNIEVKHSID